PRPLTCRRERSHPERRVWVRRPGQQRLAAPSRFRPRMGAVSEPFPAPTIPADSRTEVFLRYLDFFRSRVTAKIHAMPDAELRSSRLPSGWTPLELVKHLRYVELRWLEGGVEGRDVGDPWGDHQADRWSVGPDET